VTHPARSRRAARAIAWCGFGAGIALICFQALASTRAEASPDPGARRAGLAGYDYRAAPGGSSLAADARERTLEEWNRIAFESLAHGDPPPLTIRQSWLAWCLGGIWPDLRLTQDAERLLAGGRGLCSDAVIVLAALCARSDFRIEMIDLRGHVVAEARRGDETWIADPDLGVVFERTLAALAAPDGAAEARAALLAAGHPEGRVEAALAALTSTADNRVVPRGVLNPRLARAERVIAALDWLVPIALAAGCAAILLAGE
jgi:hypothetical protein